jgi:hypothetical protein
VHKANGLTDVRKHEWLSLLGLLPKRGRQDRARKLYSSVVSRHLVTQLRCSYRSEFWSTVQLVDLLDMIHDRVVVERLWLWALVSVRLDNVVKSCVSKRSWAGVSSSSSARACTASPSASHSGDVCRLWPLFQNVHLRDGRNELQAGHLREQGLAVVVVVQRALCDCLKGGCQFSQIHPLSALVRARRSHILQLASTLLQLLRDIGLEVRKFFPCDVHKEVAEAGLEQLDPIPPRTGYLTPFRSAKKAFS